MEIKKRNRRQGGGETMPLFEGEKITELPKTLDVTRQMLEASHEHLLTLEAANARPAGLDQEAAQALSQIFRNLNLVAGIFGRFCRNWKQGPLTQAQKGQIDEVEKGLLEFERLHKQIMFFLDHLKDRPGTG